MTKKKGTIVQLGKKGYGFILGDNGKKYFFHRKNVDNASNVELNSRVSFAFKSSEKGPIANDIQLAIEKTLSDRAIKIMFLLLFAIQIITLYYIIFVK